MTDVQTAASDLDRAKALLTGGTTCTIVRGARCETSCLRGVKPLLGWLEGDWRGASAAEVLAAHGITFCYGELTERIVNRTGDGLCPMESATLEETDPARALEKIKAKLQELTQKGG